MEVQLALHFEKVHSSAERFGTGSTNYTLHLIKRLLKEVVKVDSKIKVCCLNQFLLSPLPSQSAEGPLK